MAREHDVTHSHADRPIRNICGIVKESRVRRPRRFGKLDDMGFRHENGPRLVEADMRVWPDAEDHHVDAACRLDGFAIARAFLRDIIRHAVRHIDIFFGEVQPFAKMLPRVIGEALLVRLIQTDIFAQRENADAGEIDRSFPVGCL